MPRFVIRLKTPVGVRYLEWSTVVDAPLTFGLTWNEFQRYSKGHRADWTHPAWKKRLARLRKVGVSTLDAGYKSADDVIRANRAGEDDTNLTVEQLVDYYCVRRGEGPRPRGTLGIVEEVNDLAARRIAIVFDGYKWHVRRIKTLVHDLDHDVKIYTCDQPLANDLLTPGEAMAAATQWLDNNLAGERA